MIRKKIINPDRIRGIKGGFSFIPHRFVTDGFLSSLNQKQLLLYLFFTSEIKLQVNHGRLYVFMTEMISDFRKRFTRSKHCNCT